VPDDRLRDVGEAPAGDPRPHVEVDVLVEGEVALVVAAEPVEELAPQQAGSAADAEDLARRQVLRPLRLAGRELEGAAVAGQRLAGAVEAGGPEVARRLALALQDPRLHAAQRRVGFEGAEERGDRPRLKHGVGVEDEDRRSGDPRHPEVDGGGEAGVARQRDMRHALVFEVGNRAVAGAVVDDQELDPLPLLAERTQAGRQQGDRIPTRDDDGHLGDTVHAAQPDTYSDR
jgi:hypothetical protein